MMFRLRKGWFRRYGLTGKVKDPSADDDDDQEDIRMEYNNNKPIDRNQFPSFEEFTERLDAEIRATIRNEPKVEVDDIQLVLERPQYEKMTATAMQVKREALSLKDKQKRKASNNKNEGLDLEPFLVFHSTQDVSKVNSIVKHGYLMPGDQHPSQLWSLRMQNGNVYGDGIYCSPAFDTASWYSFVDEENAVQLIVNVLIPGRVFEHGSGDSVTGPIDKGDPSANTKGWQSDFYQTFNRYNSKESKGPFHTVWCREREIWVSGSKDRIIPVAVATVRLQQPTTHLASHKRDWKERKRKYRIPFASVPMRYVRLPGQRQEHWWLVKPAPPATITRYVHNAGTEKDHPWAKQDGLADIDYSTPFTLLVSCINGQYKWAKTPESTNASCEPANYQRKHSRRSLWQDVPELQERCRWYNHNATTPVELLKVLEGFGRKNNSGGEHVINAKKRKELEWLFGGDPNSESGYSGSKSLVQSLGALCRALLEQHGGLVPSSLAAIEALPGCSSEAVLDFWEVAKRHTQWSKRFVPTRFANAKGRQPQRNVVFEHYYVLPSSLLGQHALVTRLQDYVASWRSEDHRQYLAHCKSNGGLQITDVSSPDMLLQVHHRGEGEVSPAEAQKDDVLIQPLSRLLDHLTADNAQKDAFEERKFIVYLMIRTSPRDMGRWENLVKKWNLYLSMRRIVVKLAIFQDEPQGKRISTVLKDGCLIKRNLLTVESESPNYFWHTKDPTKWEECLQAWQDEVEHEVVRNWWDTQTVKLAVSYPFGIAGEGFLPSGNGAAASLQPVWETNVVEGQPLIFKGAAPQYMTQGGEYFATTQKALEVPGETNNNTQTLEVPGETDKGTQTSDNGDESSKDQDDLVDFARAVFCLLASYQGYLFSSQDRAQLYGRDIESLARHLMDWIEQSSEKAPPSTLKGMLYKLSGFLSSLETFGGVTFHGNWYSSLRQMKFGKKVAGRVKKVFDLDVIRQQVHWKVRPRVAEASDALFFCNRVGRPIRVRRVAASEIEPWLVHVDYVSVDKSAAMTDLFRASEKGDKRRDSAGRVVTDVLLPSCAGDEIAKLYLGYTFTQVPYLFMPTQFQALAVNAMTSCVEQAFDYCIQLRQKANGDHQNPTSIHNAMVQERIDIAMELLPAVLKAMATEQYLELVQNLKEHDNVEALLTTANGIQSVNQVLAALLLPEAAELVSLKEKWPRLCFAMLAEAVSRNCRAKVQSGKKSGPQLIDRALLIRSSSDTVDYKLNVKTSSRTTNNFMLHSYTNCSPFKSVAMLFFVQFIHQGKNAKGIADAFLEDEETTMAGFLRSNLPGWGGYATQLALYLQGLQYSKGKDRQDVRFEKPREIIDGILSDRLDHYHVQRAKQKNYNNRRDKRMAIRMAQAEPFRRYHTHPRLFSKAEVDELNKSRPEDDQLMRLPTGLLVHHCCYPDCPDFLKNFETEKDRKNGRRHGLFNHLQFDALVDNYEKGWHVQCCKVAGESVSAEDFIRRLEKVREANGPLTDADLSCARTQYAQYQELRGKRK